MDDQRTDREGNGIVSEKTKRRWLRFSLRTLLLVITVVAVWLGWNVNQVRKRSDAEKFLLANSRNLAITYGPPTKPWNSIPTIWKILGAKSVTRISTKKLDVQMYKEDYDHIRNCFPEAELTSN